MGSTTGTLVPLTRPPNLKDQETVSKTVHRQSCSNPVAAQRRSARIFGKQASRQTCSIEVTPIRMVTRDAGSKTHRIRATVGVFHQAFRETQGLPQIPGPTVFWTRKTPLIADRVVGHVSSNSIPPMPCRAFPPTRIQPGPAAISATEAQLQFLQLGLGCCGESRMG